VSEAREQARIILGEVAKGNDPSADKRKAQEGARNSLKTITELYFTLKASKTMRSHRERLGVFTRYIFEPFGHRPIHEIRRNEIVRMLDEVEAKAGPFAAEHALVALRALFNWHARRDETFASPLVTGMSRLTSEQKRGRDRVLSDDEIRAVWRAAEETSISTEGGHRRANAYGYFLRFVLLTGARRNEAANMTRDEVSEEGTLWTVPGERYKNGLAHEVPLSRMAQAVLNSVPVIGERGLVFTHNGKKPISGWTKFQDALNQRIAEATAAPLPNWTVHDLRRTARTLLGRAGISTDIAERCIGHTQPDLVRRYDQHPYLEEKRHAFEALASLIERILNPEPANVVAMKRRRR
jgi:integrase